MSQSKEKGKPLANISKYDPALPAAFDQMDTIIFPHSVSALKLPVVCLQGSIRNIEGKGPDTYCPDSKTKEELKNQVPAKKLGLERTMHFISLPVSQMGVGQGSSQGTFPEEHLLSPGCPSS